MLRPSQLGVEGRCGAMGGERHPLELEEPLWGREVGLFQVSWFHWDLPVAFGKIECREVLSLSQLINQQVSVGHGVLIELSNSNNFLVIYAKAYAPVRFLD